MKRKFLKAMACAMSVCMLAASLAGCGNNDAGGENSSTPSSDTSSESASDSSEADSGDTSDAGEENTGDEQQEEVDPNADLYPAYDLGGIELTILAHNKLGDLVPDAEGLEDYQIADRQEKKDYIEQKYNVKITFVPNPTDVWEDIPQETVRQYIAGTPVADIMDTNYTWVAGYVANNILYDFTDDFASDSFFNKDDLFWWSGKTFGISKGMGGEGLYCNNTMIKEAGMEYTPAEMFDMGKWSYDDAYDYLLELKDKLGEDEYPLFVSPYYWMLFACAANGTQILDNSGNLNYCTEPMLECLDFLKKCVENGLQFIPAYTKEDGTTGYNNWNYPGETFDQGETVAIAHRGAWQADSCKGKFDIGFVPYPWGSNVTIDESAVGQPGAYKTLSDNYKATYFDGQLVCLTNGIQDKADPMQVLSMLIEWMEWDDTVAAYVAPERTDTSYPGWIEDGTIDKELYYFSTDHERLDTFNPIINMESMDGKIAIGSGLSEAIYQGGSLRSNMESAYNQDMNAFIEQGFSPAEVFKPFDVEGEEGESGEESSEEGESDEAEATE